MNKVLIIIDAQEDFTRGALRNEEAIKALPVIHDVVEKCKKLGMHICYTMDTHQNDYLETQEGQNLPVKHCIEYTDGWNLCPEVVVNYDNVFLKKGSFGYTNWYEWRLSDLADEIWICGFCTDICVSANFQILKATYPEMPIIIIEDACAGVTPELHDAALKVMKSCQARVIKWEDLKKGNTDA